MGNRLIRSAALFMALCVGLVATGCNNSSSQGTPAPSATGSGSAATPAGTGGENASPAAGTDLETGKQIAADWLQLCIDGKYEEAYDACDDTMKGVWDSGGGIEAMFAQFEVSTGKMQSVGDNDASISGTDVVNKIKVPCENLAIVASITVNASGQVSGVLLQPDTDANAEPSALPEGVSERDIKVDAGTGYPLDGKFTAPDGAKAVPCVVLVQGSGSSGMDQVVGGNRTFEQYAHALAQRGMAVIRYDKRPYAYTESADKEDFTVADEYTEDVKAAVELAKQQPECDPAKVYIFGHSQGGMLAPRFYDEGADVAGMILFAGTPRTLVQLLDDQQQLLADEQAATWTEAQAAEYEDQRKKWREGYDSLMAMDAEAAKKAGTVYEMPAYYVYDMDKYEQPIDLIKKNDIPVLVMQGENDMQVYADKDYVMYQEGLAGFDKATFKLYPGLNHLFMPSKASTISANIAEYDVPAAVSAEAMDDIAAWIEGLQN